HLLREVAFHLQTVAAFHQTDMVSAGGVLLFSVHRHPAVIRHVQPVVMADAHHPVVLHLQRLVIADTHALVMSHRHSLVMPSGILLTHGDRLSQTHGDFLVVTDGFGVVHLHVG